MNPGSLRSTGVVGAMTLLSRITGLARDMAFSHSFGAGALMDAFLVAYKIPNFLRRLFAEGAFSQAFVPVVSEYRERRSQEDVRELVSAASGTLGGILLGVTAIGVIAAPILVLVFAPGFSSDGGQFALAVQMLRLTFPYLLFVSLTALFGGVLNSFGRFAVPAFTPVILNLVLIAFAVWVAAGSENPGIVLAAGVFVGGLVQLVFQIPSVARLGLLSWPRWRPAMEGVRKIGKLMLPGILGSSMAQVSLLLDTLIASFLVTGSIAWLYYADRLMEFPLGVFSIALATVILPGLAAHHAQDSRERFSATLDWALRLTLLITLPAAVALAVLAGPLTATIFGYGEFGAHDVRMAALALAGYAPGLLGFSLVKVLAPGYFARQDARTPVRLGLIALGVNLGFNVLVVLPAFAVGFPAPHVLLAVSTSLSGLINAVLLWRGLAREGFCRPRQGWSGMLSRILVATLVMAALVWWLAGILQSWVDASPLERAWRCALCVVAGAGTYFGCLLLLGMRPHHFMGRPA